MSLKMYVRVMISVVCVLASLSGFCRSSFLLVGNSIHVPTVPSSASTAAKVSPELAEDCLNEALCSDPQGYSAIKDLHQALDDDRDGKVDVAESDDFLREELEYTDGQERQKAFHLNKKPITVQELWQSWKLSEVHNWTVQETADWLANSVELPQYVKVFTDNAVDGSVLPRLASSSHFLSNTLGIKEHIHKRKISLKAMDVVLFGPSKNRNYVKDGFLIGLLIILALGCYYYKAQHQRSRDKLSTVMQDLECLQKADCQLKELQQELESAKQATEFMESQKLRLEKLLNYEGTGLKEGENGETGEDSIQVQQLKERIVYLSDQLRDTQARLEEFQKSGPEELRLWLHLTYEMEMKVYNARKTAASSQLKAAQDGCEKLRRKRSSFMGSFRLAHENSFDMVDARIIQAKKAYSELTEDLRELTHRWTRIGDFVGCIVSVNPGLVQLQRLLYGGHTDLIQHSTEQSSNQAIQEENYDTVSTVSSWNPEANTSPNRGSTRLAHQPSSGTSLHDLFNPPSSNLTTSLSYGAALHTADKNSGNNDKENGYSPDLEALDFAECATNNEKTSKDNNVMSESTSSLSESQPSVALTNGRAAHSKTKFIVGGGCPSPDFEDLPTFPSTKSQPAPNLEHLTRKTSAWNKTKSFSQEQSITPPRELSVAPSYYSESSLESQSEPAPSSVTSNSSTLPASKLFQRHVGAADATEVDGEQPHIQPGTEERKSKKKRRLTTKILDKLKRN